jgi:hypothetical protein
LWFFWIIKHKEHEEIHKEHREEDLCFWIIKHKEHEEIHKEHREEDLCALSVYGKLDTLVAFVVFLDN